MQERGVFCCINSKVPRRGILRNVTRHSCCRGRRQLHSLAGCSPLTFSKTSPICWRGVCTHVQMWAFTLKASVAQISSRQNTKTLDLFCLSSLATQSLHRMVALAQSQTLSTHLPTGHKAGPECLSHFPELEEAGPAGFPQEEEGNWTEGPGRRLFG